MYVRCYYYVDAGILLTIDRCGSTHFLAITTPESGNQRITTQQYFCYATGSRRSTHRQQQSINRTSTAL
jgi:hypothetical protein